MQKICAVGADMLLRENERNQMMGICEPVCLRRQCRREFVKESMLGKARYKEANRMSFCSL
jgi:hypothetical protein